DVARAERGRAGPGCLGHRGQLLCSGTAHASISSSWGESTPSLLGRTDDGSRVLWFGGHGPLLAAPRAPAQAKVSDSAPAAGLAYHRAMNAKLSARELLGNLFEADRKVREAEAILLS